MSSDLNSILGARFATSLFQATTPPIPDDRYLTEWTALLATRIETLARGGPLDGS